MSKVSSSTNQNNLSTTSKTIPSNYEEYLKIQKAHRDRQDEQLDRLYNSVVRVKNIATAIGNELDDQTTTLEEIEEGVEKASFKLKQNNKKLDKLNGESSKSSSSSSFSLFGWLW
ncbi:predicted protein [Naegleria gruberi]|uniref:Predicted protein n=1 Tax=Naegleria gruberi TaxID=5762 RepID=D2V7S8_NAEGR|nr:uncharacterized protein NAEGRDRAFT_64911 [Naegleria gruberi]EFC47054.1 predicted protein [Naegleria gruberi]|eukprot:XP_002679798.1 predicted protein [Naegleria gruberi strain NEG-M]